MAEADLCPKGRGGGKIFDLNGIRRGLSPMAKLKHDDAMHSMRPVKDSSVTPA